MEKEEILDKMLETIGDKNNETFYIAHVLPPGNKPTEIEWWTYNIKETFFRLLSDSVIYKGKKFNINERSYWYEAEHNRHCILLKGNFE